MFSAKQKKLEYYEDAVRYFIYGNRETDNLVYEAVSERWSRTGSGEDIYIALSQLMLDYEFCHQDYQEELNDRIREIIEN